MLRIDRMRADLEVVPSAPTTVGMNEKVGDLTELRRIILEVLRDELRALERRGAL